MFCWPVDSVEISKLIRNLKHTESPGYDNITASLIKEVSEGIIQPLALSIINGNLISQIIITTKVPAAANYYYTCHETSSRPC